MLKLFKGAAHFFRTFGLFYGVITVLFDLYIMVCVWSWAQLGESEEKYKEALEQTEFVEV